MSDSDTGMRGSPLTVRALHFFWILDCSGSMRGHKIGSLNFAIREAIPSMQSAARENPSTRLLVRAIEFADGARWRTAESTPMDDFRWSDVSAGGVTDLGTALKMLAAQLHGLPRDEPALPPVLVLVSDGQPTDDFADGLSALMSEPWGAKSVRVAIAVGEDADMEVLQQFTGNPEMPVLRADNSASLTHFIRWASTEVLEMASVPPPDQTGDRHAPLQDVPRAVDQDSEW